ncbi:conjugative transfer protein MobI(A/C) [Sulfuricystis multivorans]|uniref:conjugative transfer protein MobI(A/C) n=1 Tax=Sulfuricystis multivorans TaxID=2211108 RepID=UPI000F84173F|nr:conjugative transfer protein MobI(A/C) [Sulfuricystis multivorans]
MSNENALVGAKDALERHMVELYERAMEVVDEYYRFASEMNKQKDWPQKSSLKPRARQQGLSLSIEWYDKKWHGPKTNRRAFLTYIAKPRGARGYNLSKLLKYAQDWEKDKVIETENALAAIRHEAGCVMKALSYLNSAIKKS